MADRSKADHFVPWLYNDKNDFIKVFWPLRIIAELEKDKIEKVVNCFQRHHVSIFVFWETVARYAELLQA